YVDLARYQRAGDRRQEGPRLQRVQGQRAQPRLAEPGGSGAGARPVACLRRVDLGRSRSHGELSTRSMATSVDGASWWGANGIRVVRTGYRESVNHMGSDKVSQVCLMSRTN